MLETTRDHIAEVSRRIDTLEEEANKKFQDASALHSLRTKLCTAVIAEEKLLAGEWVYAPNEYVVRLVATGELDDYPEVRELLAPLHNHEDFRLGGEASLRIDDGMLSLWLPTETAMQFIEEHGITVDMTDAVSRRDTLVKKLAETIALLAKMGETP